MMFVDGQNYYHGMKNYDQGFKFDFVKLREELTDGYYTIRAYWFDSYPEDSDNKDGFFHALNMEGYRVVATPLRERGDGYVEKGVDIRLATELLAHAFNNSFDIAVIVSGDDDYERAVEYVQDLGKRVIVATWRGNSGRNLKPLADEYIPLEDIADAIEK